MSFMIILLSAIVPVLNLHEMDNSCWVTGDQTNLNVIAFRFTEVEWIGNTTNKMKEVEIAKFSHCDNQATCLPWTMSSAAHKKS